MKLSLFLIGMLAAAVSVGVIATASGQSLVGIGLLVFGTMWVAQLLYLALVALLARQARRRSQSARLARARKSGNKICRLPLIAKRAK